jgi:hypothetical protein
LILKKKKKRKCSVRNKSKTKSTQKLHRFSSNNSSGTRRALRIPVDRMDAGSRRKINKKRETGSVKMWN